MKEIRRKLAILGICAALAVTTVTGCGASNAGKAIATLDGENIDYALANFMLRYNQAQMQSIYGAWFGETLWDSYGETTRENTMNSLEQMLILEKHMDEYSVVLSDADKAKITEAATAFLADNDKDTIKAMTASQETIERMLTLQLIGNRMRTAMIADTDREVSDEEAAQKTIQYAFFSTADTTDDDGNAVALTDEEKAALKEQAEQVLSAVNDGDDLDTALTAVDEEKTSSSASYGADDENLDAALKEAADTLADGEVFDSVVETDGGYYVVVMQSTFDEEATTTKKETIISERETARFEEIYTAWQETSEFTTDADLVADLDFADTFQLATEEATSEAATTAETEAMSDTEAATEEATTAETESGS